MIINQTKQIPHVFRSLSILIVILALTIYGKSPLQANASSLADNSNAQTDSIAFAPQVPLTTGAGPTSIVIGDLDKDGKPDLVTANHGWYGNIGNTISVLRNTTEGDNFNFNPKVDFTTSDGPHGLAIADFNNDGKLDLVTANYGALATGMTVSVLRNTSTPGIIDFASAADFPVGNGPLGVAIGDLDGDGMPDLAVTNYADGIGTTITVLRNTSTGGSVAFSAGQIFTVETGPTSIEISDVDGDTKPDIVVAIWGTLAGDGTKVAVLRNTGTTLEPISFAPALYFTVGNGPRVVAIGDLNGDNKPDVVVTNFGSHDGTTVSVLKNASSPGTILFDSSVDFTVGDAPYGVAISDINNDNKADIVVTNFGNYDGTSVSVLENNGSSGNLSFKQKEDLTVGTAPHGIAIGYLNGDSLPDLAVANYGNSEGNGNTISVLLNQYNPSPVYLANFDATALPQGIQLSWQSAQENDLIGFNLYRAESQDGPQVQINTDLIPAINPGELRGNAYHYLNATAEFGKVYYYWVEWVGKGSSEIYGPVTVRMLSNWVWLPLGLK